MEMSNEWVANLIEEVFDEWLLYPRKHLREKTFSARSYRRWAVKEIADELRRYPLVHPIMVVEDFIEKTEMYSKKNPRTRRIFQIATEMGKEVLDFVSPM